MRYLRAQIFKWLFRLGMFTLYLGCGLLYFFLMLSGARDTGTLINFYWFEAETRGFSEFAPNRTRWYSYDHCGFADGRTFNCSNTVPAQPFAPADEFGRSEALVFLGNRDTYYYLSRVGWAMILVSLFWIIIGIIPAALAMLMEWKYAIAFYTTFTWLAAFFALVGATLYTGCFALAKARFRDHGRFAVLGRSAFSFLWIVLLLLLVNAAWATRLLYLEEERNRKYLPQYGSYGYMYKDNNRPSTQLNAPQRSSALQYPALAETTDDQPTVDMTVPSGNTNYDASNGSNAVEKKKGFFGRFGGMFKHNKKQRTTELESQSEHSEL